MDNITKEKIEQIIRQEIQLEDDMLDLYSVLLKKDSFLYSLDLEDRNLASEILNILLRDTKHHKIIMGKIVQNL